VWNNTAQPNTLQSHQYLKYTVRLFDFRKNACIWRLTLNILLKYIPITLNKYCHTSSKQKAYFRTGGWEEVEGNRVFLALMSTMLSHLEC